MKINDATAYKEAYSNDKEQTPQFIIDHDLQLKKECVIKMFRGSLNRHVDAPF